MLKRQTLHKSTFSKLNETVFSAQKNVNRLSNVSSQITPNATVQVDMKFYKLATNIFQVLHSKDGKRVDSNIWSFPSYETAYEFVDTLLLLGIDEKYITYPASFLLYGKENQDNFSDEEVEDELTSLEGGVFEEDEFTGEEELEDIGEDEEIDLYGDDEITDEDIEGTDEDIEGETQEELPEEEESVEVEEGEDLLELEEEGDELDILELEQEVGSEEDIIEDVDELEQLENEMEEGSDEDSELEDLLNRLEKEQNM